MKRLALIIAALLPLVLLAGDVPAAPTAGLLPDRVLTPGAVRTTDVKDICTTKTSTIRHTTKAMKDRVRAAYAGKPGFPKVDSKAVEIDHYLPLVLGGADDVKNLWPQLWDGPWGAHKKDRLEGKMGRLLCSGKISVKEAQGAFLNGSWIAAYKKYVGDE